MKIKYYCLSLKEYDKERFLITKKESFDKNRIKINRIEGINGNNYKNSKEICDEFKISLGKKMSKVSPILVAIAQSHRNIWSYIKNEFEDDYYIIFEDDIKIVSTNFKSEIRKKLKIFNEIAEPKIFLIGYLSKNNNDFSGLQCYMLSKNTASYLLKNSHILKDQIDVMISKYIPINKLFLDDKLVIQKRIESIAHNQRNIYLESMGFKILSKRIGINFELDISFIFNNTYHISFTYNTILNLLLGIILPFKVQYVIYYSLILFFEIFFYGGVIFIENVNGFNNHSKYDDDEVVNKLLDLMVFSLFYYLKCNIM